MSQKSRIERFFIIIFKVLSVFAFGAIFIFSLTETGSNPNVYVEFPTMVKDNIGLNILMGLGTIILIGVILKVGSKIYKFPMIWLAGVVSLFCMSVSLWWVANTTMEPIADQGTVCQGASLLSQGQVFILGKGQYFGEHPYQLGIVTFLRLLFLLFGDFNYRAFYYFSAIMVGIMVFAGYNVVKLLTGENKKASGIYLLLMTVCFPMYGFVLFVYGEIPSTTLLLCATWLLLSCMKKFSWWKIVLLALTAGGAVQFRRNAIILVIAFVLVLAIKCICQKSIKMLGIMLGCILGVAVSQMAINAIYDKYIPEDSQPIPTVLYITMGQRDVIAGYPGWCDMYQTATYEKCGFDADLARSVATEELKAILKEYFDNPEKALEFYTTKTKQLWTVPMYQCLAMTYYSTGENSQFVDDIYFGKLNGKLDEFMNIYQFLIYGAVLFFILFMGKKYNQIEHYILLIGIYGAFLFLMIWETKSRYSFQWFLLMIPNASISLGYIIDFACKIIGNNNPKSGTKLEDR